MFVRWLQWLVTTAVWDNDTINETNVVRSIIVIMIWMEERNISWKNIHLCCCGSGGRQRIRACVTVYLNEVVETCESESAKSVQIIYSAQLITGLFKMLSSSFTVNSYTCVCVCVNENLISQPRFPRLLSIANQCGCAFRKEITKLSVFT